MKKKLKLSRPRFTFGAKQKSELQNFALEGHPKDTLISPYMQAGTFTCTCVKKIVYLILSQCYTLKHLTCLINNYDDHDGVYLHQVRSMKYEHVTEWSILSTVSLSSPDTTTEATDVHFLKNGGPKGSLGEVYKLQEGRSKKSGSIYPVYFAIPPIERV